MSVDAVENGTAVEPFITKIELAKRLGKHTRTIDKWMARGLIPYYKLGRSVNFKLTEVDASLREACRVYKSRS